MRNLSRVSVILGALVGVSGALGFAVVGCGGDDSVSGDAGDSSTMDVTKTDGNQPDVHKKDAPSTGDSPSGDVVSDGGPDVTDGGSDKDTGGHFDAAALEAFPIAVDTAYCQRLAFCCNGADASAFNVAECVSLSAEYGGVAGVDLANTHGGHISFNSTAAAKCIADQAAFSCGSYTTAEQTAALADCTEAMTGTVGLGGKTCTSAWDCAPPAFCAGPGGVPLDAIYAGDGGLVMGSDGGTGTCTEVLGLGTACHDYLYNTDCSYVGNGKPANHCSILEDGGPGVCTADLADGMPCIFNHDCISQVCDGVTGTCQDTTVFSDPGTAGGICAAYQF
jgi:hypothetical protein